MNESIPQPSEITPLEVSIALGGTLSPEDCEDIAAMDTAGEAVGFAYTLLLENGVEDPDTLLADKGILEP